MFLCLINTTVPDRLPSLNRLKTEQRTRQMSSTTHTTTASSNDIGDVEQTKQKSQSTLSTTSALSADLESGDLERMLQMLSTTLRATPASSDDLDDGNVEPRNSLDIVSASTNNTEFEMVKQLKNPLSLTQYSIQ